MKRHKVVEFLCMIFFVIGLLLCIYPVLHRCYVNQKICNTVDSYLEWVAPKITVPSRENPIETMPPVTEFTPTKYTELWDDMVAYNEELWSERQAGLFDTWTYEEPSFCMSDYGIDQEAFGIIEIPKMDVIMPLYLGATWQHMADGAALLSQTSIPIGGVNTNAVIAGHRGWNGAPYFREILDLEIGDAVYIQNPWQKICYRVSEIQIIAPNDVDAIHIQNGRELVTLLTCHPYASGGRQRYLVICERENTTEKENTA